MHLENEAKLLASLNHPNIATIYSLENIDGFRFFTLELITGDSLARLIPHWAAWPVVLPFVGAEFWLRYREAPSLWAALRLFWGYAGLSCAILALQPIQSASTFAVLRQSYLDSMALRA